MATPGFPNVGNAPNTMHSNQHDGPAAEPTKTNMGGFLKILGGQKRTTRDGQPVKRRGPKPDSKPALTRRQELNRQAQRTHRERKEQYIRSLESELSRLRESYSTDVNGLRQQIQTKHDAMQQLKDENEYLKDILKSYNIPYGPELERRKAARKASTVATDPYTAGSTAGSQSTGYQPVFLTTPPSSLSSPLSPQSGEERSGSRGDPSVKFPTNAYQASSSSHGSLDLSSKVENGGELSPLPGIFEEDPQLGIDFILKLEAPCREHTEYLCRESYKDVEKESFFSGHALMASCPPPSHIETVPEGNQYPHQTYDLPMPDLEKLLNLSRQLITEGQVTPIMVLQSLKSHEQYRSLTREDVKTIIDTLNAKVRCYGFGAVVEDFELRDCLQAVLGTKLYYGCTPPSRAAEDAAMYG